MLNRSASPAIQQAFSKPGMVNLISKYTHLVFSIYTGDYLMLTLTKTEDPDEMSQNAAFHQGLHCLLAKIKQIFRERNCISVTWASIHLSANNFKHLAQLNSNFIWRLLRMFKWSWLHDQDGHHPHIWYYRAATFTKFGKRLHEFQ